MKQMKLNSTHNKILAAGLKQTPVGVKARVRKAVSNLKLTAAIAWLEIKPLVSEKARKERRKREIEFVKLCSGCGGSGPSATQHAFNPTKANEIVKAPGGFKLQSPIRENPELFEVSLSISSLRRAANVPMGPTDDIIRVMEKYHKSEPPTGGNSSASA